MSRSSKLYNSDLAPTPANKKNWGWFEIFNVWANDVQSLFGYTLAASLFLASGLNGWAVFAALILAGFFIMWLVNLSGKPSVKHGIPYPVFARVSMGVFGANFPAMARGLVAMFWYGAQTYAASTCRSSIGLCSIPKHSNKASSHCWKVCTKDTHTYSSEYWIRNSMFYTWFT